MQRSEQRGLFAPGCRCSHLVWLALACVPFMAACESGKVPRRGQASWSPVESTARPPARHDASLAADPGAGRLYLFGGRNLEGCLGDLWSFEPGKGGWDRIEASDGPSPRSGAGLAWDPDGGRLVLYGGFCHDELGRSQFFRDLWWFTPGEGWSREFVPGGPGQRAWHAVTVHRGRLIVFGGSGPAPRSYLQDIWALDLTRPGWVRLAADGGPRMAGKALLANSPDGAERLDVLGRDGIPQPGLAGVWTLSLAGKGWSGPEDDTAMRGSPPVDYHVTAAGPEGLRVLMAGPGMQRTGWQVWWTSTHDKEWNVASPATGPTCPTGMVCAPEPGGSASWICFGGARRAQLGDETWRLQIEGGTHQGKDRR